MRISMKWERIAEMNLGGSQSSLKCYGEPLKILDNRQIISKRIMKTSQQSQKKKIFNQKKNKITEHCM